MLKDNILVHDDTRPSSIEYGMIDEGFVMIDNIESRKELQLPDYEIEEASFDDVGGTSIWLMPVSVDDNKDKCNKDDILSDNTVVQPIDASGALKPPCCMEQNILQSVKTSYVAKSTEDIANIYSTRESFVEPLPSSLNDYSAYFDTSIGLETLYFLRHNNDDAEDMCVIS